MNRSEFRAQPVHERSLELAAAAIDFSPTSAEVVELEAHLTTCPDCARRAAALRADAHALRRTLTLLPSRRVDDAVYAAIAGRSGPARRLQLLAAAALLLAALLGAVAVGAYLEQARQGQLTTVAPSPPVEIPAAPTPRPTATPFSGTVATAIDPVVLLRVEIRGDVSVGRTPTLTLYQDGTVLRPDDAGGRITRLTPAGIDLVLAPATSSDLLVTSGDIPPDPSYQAGFTTYTIELLRGAEIIRRSTTNVLLTPATKAESERLIALAERLVDHEAWLPATAWATPPADGERYIAFQYVLKHTSFKQVGVEYPPVPLDVANVVWPLPGSLQGFGDLWPEPPPAQDGMTSRCGLLTPSEAAAVRQALVAAPLVLMGDAVQAELDWAAVTGHVTVTLTSLLPEDAPDCAIVWPRG